MKTWQRVARMAGTMPVNSIAEQLHVSVDTVRSHACKLGVSLAFYNRSWTPADNAELLARWKSGETQEAIGKAMNRSASAVRLQIGKLRRQPENRGLNRPHPLSRPVRATHVRTGQVLEYPCIRAAGDDGFIMSSICRVCRGKRREHAGYRWEYLTE